MDLQQLQSQHDALDLLAGRFLTLVDDDGVARPLGTLRWQFARELMAHLALEDQFFYPAMQRQPHVPLQEMAARLQTDDRIAREWPEFCRESRYMVETILNRMRKEEQLLMPLLAEAGLEQPLRHAG